jgi:pimeloyl-ACP methyl ester carboxylesterase
MYARSFKPSKMTSQSSRPGLLYVTLHPKPPLTLPEFNDWWNNEHGPQRMQLPFIEKGRRYKAIDGFPPEYMAYYDIADMNQMKTDTYTDLFKNASDREKYVLSNVYQENRNFCDLTISVGEVNETDKKPDVIIVLEMWLNDPAPGQDEDIHKWYVEEHVPLLEKIPGWLRSRRWKDAPEWAQSTAPLHYIAMHEFTKEHGIGGPEFIHATTTPWRQKVMGNVRMNRRIFNHYLDFSPGSRDLASLPTSQNYIESCLPLSDVEPIHYRLEGNSSIDAPVIVLVNSILTTYSIWDHFVTSISKTHPQYRFLRYDLRGRASLKSTQGNITVDVLSADLASLLDGLQIKRVRTVVGVSIGGITTLNFALRYPHRLDRFISCDCTAASPPAASEQWDERIALGEKDFPALAQATMERWFLPAFYKTPGAEYITKMILDNDWDGFKRSVKALYQFDLEADMAKSQVPGMFVAGEGDAGGIVPKVMEGMAERAGNVKFALVKDAGHLPMVENPEAFVAAVEDFL